MNASKGKRKLVFPGCCNLSDNELAELYNLDLLTDEELASVDLERKSLIEDYRLLHELSLLRKREEERVGQLERERELERKRKMVSLPKRPPVPLQKLFKKAFAGPLKSSCSKTVEPKSLIPVFIFPNRSRKRGFAERNNENSASNRAIPIYNPSKRLQPHS